MSISDKAFGKNDIRGVYGEDVTEELFYYVGRGFVKYLHEKTGKDIKEMWLTVTMDARTHSPSLATALMKGVTSTGANAVDLGLAPTPIGYYSEVVGVNANVTDGEEISGALIVTASHNPPKYNGLKLTFNKQSAGEAQIKEIRDYAMQEAASPTPSLKQGKINEYDLIPDYIDVMKKKFGRIGEGLTIVVDSANGTGGVVGPTLYRALGCKVIELYSNPDGRFPHHHPNPSLESTLTDIKKSVVENGADFGIAYDGDSDRIGIIDSKGQSMTGDKLLLIYAQDLIKKYKETQIKPIVVSEVKCSQVLYDEINALGGVAVMCKTGHGYIKSKMRETGALLAGEMSGHTFFNDRYYGFDDAIYAGCRMIEIVAKNKKENPNFKMEDMLTAFNKVFSSDEVRYPCPNELKKQTMENFCKYVKENPKMFGSEIKNIVTLDGMRIIFDGGFALIRQSNTEPVFTLRFEAKTKELANQYSKAMTTELDEILKNIQI